MRNTSTPTDTPTSGTVQGKPFKTGNANPGSRAARQVRAKELETLKARVAELESENHKLRNPPAELDAQASVINAARMRKIVSQNPIDDRGPTERTLREWLGRSPKDYFSALEDRERTERGDVDLKAENEKLKGRLAKHEGEAPGKDEGSERALALIRRCLKRSADQNAGRCEKCGRGPRD